ncbi:hypothetical protein E2C01_058291 [Portunus trituberculatus]|uniref:Uncharacterized protein n=1 Tax=Portunus trituberculatus TaxID=210409 RepID=A0A5B7GW23_PORTR|nr:hypothetical protein [Portunus trituberculatus]
MMHCDFFLSLFPPHPRLLSSTPADPQASSNTPWRRGRRSRGGVGREGRREQAGGAASRQVMPNAAFLY